MDYKVAYEPDNYRGFKDDSHLKNFLNYLFRTDITQKWTCPLTRSNIYMIRVEDGSLEYFVNVVENNQRIELKQKVLAAIKGIDVKELRNDIAYISPNIPNSEAQEVIDDIINDVLPNEWREHCPHKGMEEKYIESTICFVLHADQSYDGETLSFHIHRIYQLKK